MSYRPPVEREPYKTKAERRAANKKRQREMQDKRDKRYVKPTEAANIGLPSRDSLPADVVTTK